MHPVSDSRHPLIGLIDEISRLHGRLRSTFADARRHVGLGESEMMVLNAVVEAGHPPTVAQIGRSLGQPRQIVQRAANALGAAGLIEQRRNPDHKRAALLVASPKGVALKREADARADAIANGLSGAPRLSGAEGQASPIEPATLGEVTLALRQLRRQLEAAIRDATSAAGED